MSAGSGGGGLRLDALSRGSWATFVHGPSRAAVLRVTYALARANDRAPFWLSIRDPGDAVPIPGPLELGWIPKEQAFVVTRQEAAPHSAVPPSAIWNVVRPDEPSQVVSELVHFLELPESVQRALGRFGGTDQPRVFVIANSDRVREVYPNSVEGVRPIIDSMLRSGGLPIFAAVSPPGPGRLAFDFVFEVRIPALDQWRDGILFCEKAPEGSGFSSGQTARTAETTSQHARMRFSNEPP